MDFGSVTSQYRLTDKENIAKILNSPRVKLNTTPRSTVQHEFQGVPYIILMLTWESLGKHRPMTEQVEACNTWHGSIRGSERTQGTLCPTNVTGVFIS